MAKKPKNGSFSRSFQVRNLTITFECDDGSKCPDNKTWACDGDKTWCRVDATCGMCTEGATCGDVSIQTCGVRSRELLGTQTLSGFPHLEELIQVIEVLGDLKSATKAYGRKLNDDWERNQS